VLDYSDALLDCGKATAAARGWDMDFIRGDASDTGLPAESFDHVLILGNSLGYLPGAADDVRIMKEAHRLLRSGGWLLVDVTDGSVVRRKFSPNAWHEIEGDIVVCRERELGDDCIRAREVVLSKERGLVRDRTYAIRTYGPDRLAGLVKGAGFDDVSIRRGFSSREVEDPVLLLQGEQITENIHLTPGQVLVANRAGVGDEVDIIEERLPPIGVNVDTHHSSGWAPKLKRPSAAKIAGDPPQGWDWAISNSSSSMSIMAESSPWSHILSSSRQSSQMAPV
jgi:SAM-dependent methyltransferase